MHWNTVINLFLNGNALDHSESGSPPPVSSNVVWIPKNPKQKIANLLNKGIQVFFAAMVLFGDDDGPSLSVCRIRLRAPDSRDARQPDF